MKSLLVTFLLLYPAVALSEWIFLPDTTLAELYALPESDIPVQSGVPGVASLSWPNGNQAIVTYVEAFAGAEKALHRCIEYFSPEMESISMDCYRLEED